MNAMLDKIDDYLAGRLADDDLDQFEEELLTNEELQREVRVQVAFREALVGESDALLAEPVPDLFTRLIRFISTPAWSFSATAVSAALVVTVYLGDAENSIMGSTVQISYVDQTRSAQPAAIYLPSRQIVVLSIDSFGVESKEVDVDVRDEGQALISIPGVRVDQQQLINVMFGPLSTGQYTLHITGDDNDSRQYPLIVE